ncbi:MAG: hypothetical protein PHU65_03030 [Actinomycetota bacterium]|nr:hypothetical protein [Actinomycetota bacterium]
MRKLLIAISLILTLSLIIPAASCARVGSKITENAIEKALEKASDGNVDLDLQEGGAVVKDEKGGETQIGENVNLPEGWPSDVPVYPDTNFSMSTKTKNGETDKNEYAVWGIITKGSAEEAYNWYKSKFSGWDIVTDQYTKSDDGDLAFLYLKSSAYEVSVTIGESDDETSLGMQVIEQ